MVFMNNIWIAISTPNEALIYILTLPLLLLENYICLLLFSSILELKLSTKQKILYILLTSICGFISVNFIPHPYNIFINYIFSMIIAYNILKTRIIKSILTVILPTSIFALVGTLILNPYITFLGITYEQSETIPIFRLGYLALMYSIILLIVLVFKYKNLKLSILDYIDKKSKYIIFANLMLGLLNFSIQMIILFLYIEDVNIFVTFLSFLSLLTYFIISIYSLTRAIQLTLTTKKLESAEAYNNTLRILHDSVRGFKHDFDNIVTTIGGYIRTNDMNGLKAYYTELEDDCQRVNNLYISNPKVINNDGIYNLLTKKYNEADSKDIKINITFLLDLSALKMKIYEFARILGILIDNAIEASSECEEKIINLSFRDDTKNSRQLITIENTYANKDVDTEKIFEKGITEKKNHTGLGLWEVRKIIKKNNNINLFTTKDEKFFIQQLEIYY